jgi:hypothetical protein
MPTANTETAGEIRKFVRADFRLLNCADLTLAFKIELAVISLHSLAYGFGGLDFFVHLLHQGDK